VDASQAQKFARVASMLILLSIFAGGFAEVYVPGKLLALSDPVATARIMPNCFAAVSPSISPRPSVISP